MISQNLLKSLLDYDPESGLFTWRAVAGHHGKATPGERAGCPGKRGYIYIGIRGKRHQAHRLAWLYHYGYLPAGLIDHINCDPLDNRISNLRLCNKSQNMANRTAPANNTSGIKGVVWDRGRGKWAARICVNYRTLNLGRFENIDDAAAAYEQAARTHFGSFARAA